MIAYLPKIHPCHDGGQTKWAKEKAKPMPKAGMPEREKVAKRQNGSRPIATRLLLSEAVIRRYCYSILKIFTKIITLTRFNQLVLTSAALNLVS